MTYIAAKGSLWLRLLTTSVATLAGAALFAVVAVVPNQSIYYGPLGSALSIGLALVGFISAWYGIRLRRAAR